MDSPSPNGFWSPSSCPCADQGGENRYALAQVRQSQRMFRRRLVRGKRNCLPAGKQSSPIPRIGSSKQVWELCIRFIGEELLPHRHCGYRADPGRVSSLSTSTGRTVAGSIHEVAIDPAGKTALWAIQGPRLELRFGAQWRTARRHGIAGDLRWLAAFVGLLAGPGPSGAPSSRPRGLALQSLLGEGGPPCR